MFDTFHFLRPWWLAGMIPLLAIAILCYRTQRQPGSWAAVCDAHLLPHLLVGSNRSSLRPAFILLSCGWIFTILALAGPVWSKLPQPVFRSQSALLLILDLSQSMNAQDVRPSRLERAKFKLLDILKTRREGLTGLIVFANESFIVSPLTDDTNTIAAMVPALTTQLMPVQGSHLEQALQDADRLFEQNGSSNGHILVLTDGPPSAPNDALIKQLRKKGRRISILGIGTEDGAPIPVEDGGFLHDDSGDIIIPTLPTHLLRTMAKTAGGLYIPMTMDNQDVHKFLASIPDHTQPKTRDMKEQTTTRWKEEGPWLILVILVFAAPAFRPGWMGLLVFLTILPHNAYALTWDELWMRPDQRGATLLKQTQTNGSRTGLSRSGLEGHCILSGRGLCQSRRGLSSTRHSRWTI